MAALTNDSTLNTAIGAARKHGAEVEISNTEVTVYWSHRSTGDAYARGDRFHMAELLRDLREGVDAIEHGY